MWGALATGIWATKAVNTAGADGLLYGNGRTLLVQCGVVAVTAVYSFSASWLLLKLVDFAVGLRATEDEERIGLDLTQHREAGYTVID
jgi:Amt family ammonium transporter